MLLFLIFICSFILTISWYNICLIRSQRDVEDIFARIKKHENIWPLHKMASAVSFHDHVLYRFFLMNPKKLYNEEIFSDFSYMKYGVKR